jgi:hypothetical protein
MGMARAPQYSNIPDRPLAEKKVMKIKAIFMGGRSRTSTLWEKYLKLTAVKKRYTEKNL